MRRMLFVIFMLMVIPLGNKYGSYDHESRLAYCTDRLTCVHEIGHGLDQGSGWISQTFEFQVALEVYLQGTDFDITRYNIQYFVDTTEQDPYREAYAWFFAYSDGDIDKIPEEVRRFYDKRLAAKFMRQVNNYVMLLWDI